MRLRLAIEGMVAVHAKRALFTALAGVRGVRHADVEMGSAVLEADDTLADSELRLAVESVGLRLGSLTRELPLL